jgi:hypothetical protein
VDFAESAARNEEIFRRVNERIEAGAERHDVATPLPFHCECADAACVEKIEMPPSEYDRIASDVLRFVVMPGHEREEIERVIERRDGYLVVQKTGEAREQIQEDHPRGRHRADGSEEPGSTVG